MYTLFFHGYSKISSSCAAVLYNGENEIWWGNHYMDHSPNAIADYTGLIMGLTQAFVMNISDLVVKSDSFIIKQLSGEYNVKSKKLISLFNEAKHLEDLIGDVSYIHIDHSENKRAINLSVLSIHYI